MSPFFLLNNLHFSLEILGALAFLVAAWLAFDAFAVRKDFLTASRGVGFALLAAWQVIHAFQLDADLVAYVGYTAYLFGIVFVLWNLLLEAPSKRPTFKAVLVLPALGTSLLFLDSAVAVGLLFIALLAFRQYKRELKKTLAPFWLGFGFLALGAFSNVFADPETLSGFWILGHFLELLGFFALGWWIWRYLELRIREEMLLIFVSVTLFMAVIVSLTFSSILIDRIEAETRENLATDVRVLDFATSRLQQEALAKTRLLASRADIQNAVVARDFVALEALTSDLLEQETLGFLVVADEVGEVLLRAHALSQKGESIAQERAVAEALEGRPLVTTASSPAEKFSIRAAAPLTVEGEVVGVLVAGFLLDNVFADDMKRVTGLEMSIYEGDTRVATTALNPDGRTRSVGIKQVDPQVLDAVLTQGKAITLRTTILSRPFLASYLPIRDAEGDVVGMRSAAKPQRELLETANVTNRLTLVIVMAIMLILVMPIYFLTRRLGREVA